MTFPFPGLSRSRGMWSENLSFPRTRLKTTFGANGIVNDHNNTATGFNLLLPEPEKVHHQL